MTKKTETKPMECFFDPKNASEGACSAEKLSEGSFCFGCQQYICEGHSRNQNMPFGRHVPSVHLVVEEEEDD